MSRERMEGSRRKGEERPQKRRGEKKRRSGRVGGEGRRYWRKEKEESWKRVRTDQEGEELMGGSVY